MTSEPNLHPIPTPNVGRVSPPGVTRRSWSGVTRRPEQNVTRRSGAGITRGARQSVVRHAVPAGFGRVLRHWVVGLGVGLRCANPTYALSCVFHVEHQAGWVVR